MPELPTVSPESTGLLEGKGCSGTVLSPLSSPGTGDRGLGEQGPPSTRPTAPVSGCGGWWLVLPAHLKLSPIRICCLTSRLSQIGCSDLTHGSTGEKKLLKDFAAGAASERPALTIVLSHPRGSAPVVPRLHPATPRLSQGTLTLRSPRPSPTPHPNSRPLLATAPGWGPLPLSRPQSSLPCGHPVGLHPAASRLSAESSGDTERARRGRASRAAGDWPRWREPGSGGDSCSGQGC